MLNFSGHTDARVWHDVSGEADVTRHASLDWLRHAAVDSTAVVLHDHLDAWLSHRWRNIRPKLVSLYRFCCYFYFLGLQNQNEITMQLF